MQKNPELPDESKPLEGLVQIFTGDGKGKTSAALGTVVRALGRGLRVCIVVFMKGDYPYSEWKFFSGIEGVTVERFGFTSFTDPDNVKPEEIEQAEKALAFAREAMLSGTYDLLVMDEVNVAVGWKLINVEDVVSLVKERPANVELILTGRRADERLVELADMVTECRKVKHPFDKGILARRGIDF
jgi:cob(I)alamin adenosyltransferase